MNLTFIAHLCCVGGHGRHFADTFLNLFLTQTSLFRMVVGNIEEKVWNFPTSLLTPHILSPPYHQHPLTHHHGLVVTTDEPTQMYHHPKSIVCIRVHFQCCSFHGFPLCSAYSPLPPH